MGSGLIWIYYIDRYGFMEKLNSLIREVILKIIKVCTVHTNILRGDEI